MPLALFEVIELTVESNVKVHDISPRQETVTSTAGLKNVCYCAVAETLK